MKNQDKTGEELVRELESLRARIAELEETEARLKETERLLVESAERFAFALDAAELSFWDWNLTTGKAIWGYRAFERLGYSPGEIESDIKTWKHLVHPQDWPRVSKTLNDHLAGDLPFYESEHRTRTRAGDWLWILARGKVVERDLDGRPVRLIGISLDITERKQAEETLRESEEKYRRIFDNAFEGMFQTTPDGRLISANPACARILGYASPEEVISDITNLARQLYARPEDREVLTRRLDDEAPLMKQEVLFRRKDGTPIWVSINAHAVPDESGKVLYYEGTIEDITSRKGAEEKLAKSEALLEAILDASPVGITLVKNRRQQWANRTFCDLVGYEPDEIEEVDVRQFYMSDDDYRRTGHTVYDGIAEGEVRETELVCKRSDGTSVPCLIRATMIDDPGNLTAVVLFLDITERKKAEETLRESEEKFSTAFRSAPNPMLISSLEDGTLVEVNDEWVVAYGYERSEVLGRTAAEFGIWTDADSRSSWLRQIMNEGYARNVDLSFSTKDGRLKQGLLSTAIIQLQGKPFLLSTCNDVTDLKRSEEALREREQMLTSILLATPVGLCLTENGCIRWANTAWERMFGFTDESEYVGRPTSTIFGSGPEYLTAEVAVCGNLASQTVGEIYTDFMRKDASPFRGHLRSTYLDPSDPGKGTLSAISDLTEITQSEQARRESEERYRVLFEDSIDAVFVTAQDGRFMEVNRAFCDLFGYERSELEGLTSLETYADPAQRRMFQEAIEKSGSIKDFPIQFRKRDGTMFEGFLTASVRYGGKGEIVGYQGIIRDVTERKQLEKQLLQAQKMEAVGTLASGVAHDFNNILTIVQGFSELILMETNEKASAYSDLRKINEAGRRGAELVRNLLTFSRKAETNPRRINLNDEVVRVEKLLSRTIPKMIKIELHLEGDLAAVHADPHQMGQVLMNLAVNAEHAMPDGGNLTIATANIRMDEQHCRSYPEMQPGNYVLLTVSDTGHGMDEETLEHIFEPFFTTKNVREGTGLGLAMVYGIIRQHGGHVACYSEPGHGATFEIYLPALPASEIESGEEPEEALPPGGSETILLVDDEDSIRELGTKFLTRAGYTVLSAASGPEAVQLYLIEGERISLVVLDLIMPEMGGEKCLEEILAINKEAKIIISSGAAVEEKKKKKTFELGAKGFVSKPFLLRDMLKTVREVLDAC